MRSAGASTPTARPTGRTRVRSRYRDNMARHLIGISRDLQFRVTHYLSEERGFRGLRPSFGPLLSLIWIEGRPLTAIASQLAISKQACSQLANLAEEAGYLKRQPDPEDRRSKLVMLTPRGRVLVEQAVQILLESESEYADLVGATSYRRFTASLAALYQGLGIPTHADPALTASAGRSIGVLPLIAVRVQRDLMEATIARGHAGLKMSHAEVLPLIGAGGGRIHEIARIQQVSRQAISLTARDLEDLGYLCREPDPRDRRGVVLRLTDRGNRLIGDSVAALDGLERSFRDVLGGRRLEDLQRVARDLHQALHLEEEVFESGLEGRATPSATRSRTPGSGERDIQRLATTLRRQLDRRDTALLVELLEPRSGRTAT